MFFRETKNRKIEVKNYEREINVLKLFVDAFSQGSGVFRISDSVLSFELLVFSRGVTVQILLAVVGELCI